MAGESILIIDDNPTNLKLAAVLLRGKGYVVSTAPNAESAMVSLETSLPQLILMDVQLPKMDGLELTRILKAKAATKHITIVALTAYAMKGDDAKAFAAGCDGYITKPIDTRTLPTTIAMHLSKRKLKNES